MKKIIWLIIIIVLASCASNSVKEEKEEKKENKMKAFLISTQEEDDYRVEERPEGNYPVGSVVDKNGDLYIDGRYIKNKDGEIVQLKGISSHGLQWYGEFANRDNLEVLVDEWGIDIFRAAMYTVEGGYIYNNEVKKKVVELVEITEELGIYCIIDWHMLLDNNPNMYKDEAIKFFEEMATLFKNKKHVLFEIANEPNGRDVSWLGEIRPYAVEVVEAIRGIKQDGIIIVGTPTWSQDVDDVIGNELPYENIAYTLHFYAGTHGQYLRDKGDKALANDLAIFVSEWGTTEATGDDGVYPEETKVWVDWMDENRLSWLNWNLSNKAEDSALLLPSTSYRRPFTDDDLSESGRLLKSYFIKYNSYRN